MHLDVTSSPGYIHQFLNYIVLIVLTPDLKIWNPEKYFFYDSEKELQVTFFTPEDKVNIS